MKYLVLFFSSLFFAQQNVNKAQKNIFLAEYYEITDLEKAFSYYQKAFELNPYEFKTYMPQFTKICLKLNKESILKKEIYRASSVYLFSADHFKSDRMKPFYDKQPIKEILSDDIEKLQKIYYTNAENYAKIEYEKKIIKIDAIDQFVRKKRPIDWGYIEKSDSLNITQLIELTKHYGWHEGAEIILWHQRDSYDEPNFVWNYFIPFFNQQIKKDLIRKDYLLKYEKNMCFVQKITYKYDYFPPLDRLYTLEDIHNIDKYRKTVGLPPLYFNKHIMPEYVLPKGYEYDHVNLLKDLLEL